MTQVAKKRKLLLIDDNDLVRNILHEVLEISGFNVIDAVDGEAGINAYRDNKQQIQMIISDVLMPRMNGKQVYDEIRKLNQDINILFISGYTDDLLANNLTQDNKMFGSSGKTVGRVA
jgi:two-component system cell cycle sensor histidine kinase/response regulator CckA